MRQGMASRQQVSRVWHNAYANPVAGSSHIVKTTHSREQGAFAVMFVPLLIVMIGFWGLALDIGQVYTRKVDMYGIAKAAALAAARELNGTPEGLAEARKAAREAVANLRYQSYGSGTSVAWSDDALSFGTSSSATGTWIASAGGASSLEAAGLFFARVNTADLGPAIGQVDTFFMKILTGVAARGQVSDSAIAGRTSVKAMPIGICAMSPDPATARPATSHTGAALSELVQYGFRRGISYDLMQLSPNTTTPIRFAINPVAEPGTNSSSFNIAGLQPFVCSGSMWVKRLTGGTVRVSALPDASPLASLKAALNTRFDNYGNTGCTALSAPPDQNIKSYTYDVQGVVKWMSPNKGALVGATTTERGKSEPVIDLPTPPASPGDYGPLWAYARAVKAPSPADAPEPNGGYEPFSVTEWPGLYPTASIPPTSPTSPTYPAAPAVPYIPTSTVTAYSEPPRPANRPVALRDRRVLNIPLLSCTPTAPSGSNASANVVAIGKFFMTVPASDNSLIAEFAGLLPLKSMPGHVELFP
jgi:Flp pilus assembly protein TadG